MSKQWGEPPEGEGPRSECTLYLGENIRARLMKRARYLFRNQERAEDAVSECILRTRGVPQPMNYHLTILSNIHKDFCRKRGNKEILWIDTDPNLMSHLEATQSFIARTGFDALLEEWDYDAVYRRCRQIWPEHLLYALEIYWRYFTQGRGANLATLEAMCNEEGYSASAVRSAFYRGCIHLRRSFTPRELSEDIPRHMYRKKARRKRGVQLPSADHGTNGYSQNNEGGALDFHSENEI